MKGRGYLTQCDRTNGQIGCQNATRLEKPGKWRCPSCEEKFGKIQEQPQ